MDNQKMADLFGGHQKIHDDLLKQLRTADIPEAARNLDLILNSQGALETPFLGTTYLISSQGVARTDGKAVPDVTASALIHYVLHKSTARPTGKFVPFADLAGPLFKRGSYSASAFEQPIIRRFQGRTPELATKAESLGGRREGMAGMGGMSLVLDLLPHILVQIVFYDGDEEFPARATVLFDANATRLIDFEALAVLMTLFVRFLTRKN